MGAEGRITNGATVQKDDRGEKRDNVFSKLFFLQWEKWVGHQKVKKKTSGDDEQPELGLSMPRRESLIHQPPSIGFSDRLCGIGWSRGSLLTCSRDRAG